MIPNDIDQQAPVISRHSAVIEAPIEVLWGLHTDVDAWPSWQPDIETARLDGSFDPGSTFSWQTGGLDIESTIYRVEPERRTLWGGPAHGIVGIHEWTFTPARRRVRLYGSYSPLYGRVRYRAPGPDPVPRPQAGPTAYVKRLRGHSGDAHRAPCSRVQASASGDGQVP